LLASGLAREKQVTHRVIPTSNAIDESVDLAHQIYSRVFRKGASASGQEKARSMGMSTNTTESLRVFLAQQLEDVEADVETISSYIAYNTPETSGELLKLRELQRKYREIAASIKNEIAKLG
jgi:hypothetical protein